MLHTSRRGFLAGLGALIAAPAIVKATSIMPVKVYPELIQPTPAALDRINQRFVVLKAKETLEQILEHTLFEPNDAFTRARVSSHVDAYLQDMKNRRAIEDYVVVCDNTNNPPHIIDNNQLYADLYIKPTRSIEYITLNTIVNRTGIDCIDFESLITT